MNRLSLIALTATVAMSTASMAAPIILLQDYEAPGNLDDPFNLSPGFSGSSGGIDGSGTITHIPDDGAAGTSASAEIFVPNDSTNNATAGGWAWQVRFLPNSAGGVNANNPQFPAIGSVGYYLKVDASVSADLLTAPVLETVNTLDATGGALKTVIKDGQWHLYQWDMTSAADFPNSFDDIFGGGIGNNTLGNPVSFDSIAIVSSSGSDATIRIDQIGYVPEPGTALLLTLAATCLGSRLRRS